MTRVADPDRGFIFRIRIKELKKRIISGPDLNAKNFLSFFIDQSYNKKPITQLRLLFFTQNLDPVFLDGRIWIRIRILLVGRIRNPTDKRRSMVLHHSVPHRLARYLLISANGIFIRLYCSTISLVHSRAPEKSIRLAPPPLLPPHLIL